MSNDITQRINFSAADAARAWAATQESPHHPQPVAQPGVTQRIAFSPADAAEALRSARF